MQVIEIYFRVSIGFGIMVYARICNKTSSLLKTELYKLSYGAFLDVDLIDGEISLKSLVEKRVDNDQSISTVGSRKGSSFYMLSTTGTEKIEVKRLNTWTNSDT